MKCFAELHCSGRHLLARNKPTLTSTSNTNSTSGIIAVQGAVYSVFCIFTVMQVREYFLPELGPQAGKQKKQNALSITYYY